jgi:hypothetical protein
MKNNKESYSWISVLDRLPDHDGRYICTVRVEEFRNNIFYKASEYVRLTDFGSGKFGFDLDIDHNDELSFKMFATHWLETPMAVEIDHSISIYNEYSIFSEDL